ncbi:hypothetical protein OPIT5_01320 [Opitutaceae bacterium TAV5]|nr:hypothetical protein OPIT5_01320 [Opitutaceae bacterium TAV5]
MSTLEPTDRKACAGKFTKQELAAKLMAAEALLTASDARLIKVEEELRDAKVRADQLDAILGELIMHFRNRGRNIERVIKLQELYLDRALEAREDLRHADAR